MTNSRVIQEIRQKQPQINYRLKFLSEEFIKSLFKCLFDNTVDIEAQLQILEKDFKVLADIVCWDEAKKCSGIWNTYVEKIPAIMDMLVLDAKALDDNDPASASMEEVYLAYPGFYAIAVYRLSHELYKMGLPLIPRLMTEYAHQITGVDIHPGAEIGESFFIDHATGIVIGETTVIKNNVRLYQGVTLGALYVDKSLRNGKRHPTVEDNVTIYANATILGGDTVIGANSIIGGNVWLTRSVSPNSMVYHTPEIKIKTVAKK
jgi:serine O-acetyltransferase